MLVGLIGFVISFAIVGEDAPTSPFFLNVFMTGMYDHWFRLVENAFFKDLRCCGTTPDAASVSTAERGETRGLLNGT